MSAPKRRTQAFDKDALDRTVITRPLLDELEKRSRQRRPRLLAVIIDVNLEYPAGRDEARAYVVAQLNEILSAQGRTDAERVEGHGQYVFARLSPETLLTLTQRDAQQHGSRARAIFRIWPDFEVHAFIHKSVRTVKADAARISFSASGDDIVWAVLDSGIDAEHPHFALHRNLELDGPLEHRDYTGRGTALSDEMGHGTHVAGILAGEIIPTETNAVLETLNRPLLPLVDGHLMVHLKRRDERGDVQFDAIPLDRIAGVAPRTKLLSLRVLDHQGKGHVSHIIRALADIQEINGYGRRLRVHGVNLSVGYPFDAEWFACGQSPLCVEINQLVRSGVVVVVAAGNTGYGSLQTASGMVQGALDLSINDPGNADLAITVGATHRDMPHVYGVSYFSSKGPTGDGRLKPDLVAPGERILSCAAGAAATEAAAQAGHPCQYLEDSGTSMAAPHVSGAIAAFLSVRREFIGQPDWVKRTFLETATDLGRDRHFQGRGLVDLMRAIQSV
ncbi:S8 family peptidase [Deinococcus soli (ex Cha et al. 2016)]|uniref:S8 family peptidase n=1 Tax=Deinococcus soli (ex Cha et al. 2016) TaxID=1309411 RepID=UPI0019CA6183|nr:S8 family peptidase [Deinococcus soli (ex Cha et al. 2016)]GGB79202.1 peptidase S8 [Deinococcus soli (ex Cha et al. 2016)]